MSSPMDDIVDSQRDAFQGFFDEVRDKMKQMQGEMGLIEDLKQFAAAIEWTVRCVGRARPPPWQRSSLS